MNEASMCVLCGSQTRHRFKLDNCYNLLECVGCGFQFVSPRPTIHDLQSVYDPPPEGTFAAKSSEEARRVAIRIERFLSPHTEGRQVLEVGCNTGFILHGLSQLGYSVAGTDLSSTALAYARREYRLTEVYCSEFPPDNRAEGFDIVLASHIIEHVIDPLRFVQQCARFLKPGGLLLVLTPNVRSSGMRVFGRHYPVFCPPIHINYFSEQTLGRLIEGRFETVKLKTDSYWADDRNTAFNSLVSISHLLRLKIRLKQSTMSKTRPETPSRPSGLIQFARTTSQALQLLAAPAVAICDRAGAGENISLLARKI